MTMEEFSRQRFYTGLGFKISPNGPTHLLAAVDFDTGECEDDDGQTFGIESIYQFLDI